MTIASALIDLDTDIKNARTAITNKGGTVTVDGGSSQLATDIATIPTGGGGGTIEPLNVTPSTSAQTITASGGVDGYSPVNVSAVTSSIDSNITAGNIKKNVVILGVTGSYEGEEFIGIPRELVNGTFQPIQGSHTYTLPDSVLHLGGYAFYGAFYSDAQIRSIDFNNLTDITGVYCLYAICQSATRITSVDFGNVTTINATFAMGNAFYGCTALTDVNFSKLRTISGTNALSTAFRNTSIVNLDLSSVTSITGSNTMSAAFRDCTHLTSADFSSVTLFENNQVMANIFTNCTALASVDFSSLITIGKDTSPANYGHFTSAFNNCSSLTTLTFPELTAIYCTGGTSGAYGTFANNNYVQKMYFPKLQTMTYGTGAASNNRNACKNIFYGCSALTELHFAAANQSAIEASDGYSTAWGRGAGNVTIYFDL